MQTRVGNCFVEYIWPAHGRPAPEVLERFPFWSAEPSAEYFRGLAHAGIPCLYRPDHLSPREIMVDGSPKQVFPEAVRIVDQDGNELCRWTALDEYEEIRHH
jgi:hypothetical protein